MPNVFACKIQISQIIIKIAQLFNKFLSVSDSSIIKWMLIININDVNEFS